MNREKIERRIEIAAYILFAAFYFWMAAQIPYTHDDWDWGLDIGMQQFLQATINSRYVGNFFEVVMTRSELLKNGIMGSCCFLIPYLLSRFAAKESGAEHPHARLFLFLVCNCLLLTMNRVMWRQAYGWVAGFANYVISAIFLMVWIREILRAFEATPEGRSGSPVQCILCFVSSLCCQLFLENLSLYCVILAVFLCATHYFRCRKIPTRTLLMLIGSIIGLVIMFSSSLYDTLLSTGSAVDSYRRIPMLEGYSIWTSVRNLMLAVMYLGARLYSANLVLSGTVLAVFICLLVSKNCSVKSNYRIFLTVVNSVLILCLILCHIYDSNHEDHANAMFLFDFVVSATFFLAILGQVLLLFRGSSLLPKLLTLWLSAPLVIAPLAVTTEIGHRLFFTSNVFVIGFVLILLSNTVKERSFKPTAWITGFVAMAAVLLLCYHGSVYSQIGACKRARDAIISEAIQTEAAQITLPAFPYPEYLHAPDPVSDLRLEYFKEFYGIPQHTEVLFQQ